VIIFRNDETEKSAIRIQKDDLDTSVNLPVLCHQCKEMKCLKGKRLWRDWRKRNLSGTE